MKLKPNSPKMIQPIIMKKQRTNRSRRNRIHFSPILCFSIPDADVSCDSSALTSDSNVVNNKRKLSNDLTFRRNTRSCFRKENEVEVSEASCVESNNNSKEAAVVQVSENDTVSVAESCYNDLACTEQLSYNDIVSDYSSSQESVFSEVYVSSSSELEFSDYTPSIFFDSGSEFSEKSVCNESPPSETFSLLLEFRRQFVRSSASVDHATRYSSSSLPGEHALESSAFVKFEDEEDEESYKRLRERERKQVYTHDYVELYRSTTEYGELVIQQRLKMVHWIIEQSKSNKYQQETMFLGVSLLDRFLSKGLFKNKRNLQIVGIACLTLATRIEENQPYNSVREKNFYIGNNEYSRFEVVAMEWLVQEVLNFQCFMPTICNFMWFYLKAAKADADLEKKARYLAVLAQSDHEQLAHWPSTVAAGLVILACVDSNDMDSYRRVIEVHVRTEENDLHECVKNLEWLLQYVN